jgi:TolB-like protein
MKKFPFCKFTYLINKCFLGFFILLCLCSNLFAGDSTTKSKLTIAVVDLDNMKGVDREDAIVLSERLRSELYETGKYIVVERKQMEKILAEQGFSLTGCVDNMCYVKAGRILGVSLIVVGSVSNIEGMYSITTRIVDVETAEYKNTAILDINCDIRGLLTDGMKYLALKLTGDSPPMPEVRGDRTIKYSKTDNSSDDKDTYLYFSFFPGFTGYDHDTISKLIFYDQGNDYQAWLKHVLEEGLTLNAALGVSFKKLSIELGFCSNTGRSPFVKEDFSGGVKVKDSIYEDEAGIAALWLIGKYHFGSGHGITPYVTFGPLLGGHAHIDSPGFNLGAGLKIPVTRRLTFNLEVNFFTVPGDEFGGTTIYNIKFTPAYAIKFF